MDCGCATLNDASAVFEALVNTVHLTTKEHRNPDSVARHWSIMRQKPKSRLPEWASSLARAASALSEKTSLYFRTQGTKQPAMGAIRVITGAPRLMCLVVPWNDDLADNSRNGDWIVRFYAHSVIVF